MSYLAISKELQAISVAVLWSHWIHLAPHDKERRWYKSSSRCAMRGRWRTYVGQLAAFSVVEADEKEEDGEKQQVNIG